MFGPFLIRICCCYSVSKTRGSTACVPLVAHELGESRNAGGVRNLHYTVGRTQTTGKIGTSELQLSQHMYGEMQVLNNSTTAEAQKQAVHNHTIYPLVGVGGRSNHGHSDNVYF